MTDVPEDPPETRVFGTRIVSYPSVGIKERERGVPYCSFYSDSRATRGLVQGTDSTSTFSSGTGKVFGRGRSRSRGGYSPTGNRRHPH